MNVALTLANLPAARQDRSDIGPGDVMKQVLGGDVSDATRATIDKAPTVPQALALTLGSPEFQRR
jgi:uncharacterized protein (DUF1800 family)